MRKYFLSAVLAAMVMVIIPACAGIIYNENVDLGGGDQANVVGRTGLFGTDLAAVRFKNKAPNDPDILRLQSFESRQATTQTYDQRCPDPRQLKNIKTTTVNERKVAYQDVPNPNKRQDQIAVIGGTNPSVGNVLLPAAAEGAGLAFSGSKINIVQGGASAVVKGVKGGGGGAGGGGGNAAAGSTSGSTSISGASTGGPVAGSGTVAGATTTTAGP